MSKQIKKKIIGLVTGLVIIGGSVATAIILANLANRNILSYIITYNDLLAIRNKILSSFSKTGDEFACSNIELSSKVKDGSLKQWINEHFKDCFKPVSDNVVFDFNLNISENENEILLILTPSENKTLRLDQFTNKYDPSIVEFTRNKVTFKFLKSDFFKEQLFNYEQLLNFQKRTILDMQNNKITFESLMNVSNETQKTSIIDWISKSLKIPNIFSDVQFNKLSANNTYSIKLTANNDYILNWINNQKDTAEFIIERKSITINFNNIITLTDNVLEQLKQKVNMYLQQQNIHYTDWFEHFESQDQIYQSLLEYIYNQLNLLINNTLPIDCIERIELNNDNNVYNLKIIPKSGYSFLSSSEFYDVGNIILHDIDIYSYIEFNKNNIDSFVERIQDNIDLYKYSPEQFNQWVNTNEFKEFVGANLKTANNLNININKIKNISYELTDNILIFSPQTGYKFKLLESISNVSINEKGELLINTLNLYEYIHFTKLSELFNGVQQFIDQFKLSAKEFREYVDNTNNWVDLKNLIAQSLFVSETNKINVDKILNFRFENKNLIITLDENYTIYSVDSYANVSLTNDSLIIKNLAYFDVVDLVKLNDLFNVIQTLIDDNKYTLIEFNQYFIDNFDTFKTLIANNLFVNENDTILETEITNITFENGILRISLNNNYVKYNLEQNDNFELDGTDLLIKNLNYYNEINFDNLDNLFNAIQDKIQNDKYTIDEFNSYLTNDFDAFKQLVSDNLYISENEKLSVDNIASVDVNANTNQLNIELNNNYLKYTITSNNNITLTDTTLTINNLQYYTSYNFVDINQLFNAIQDYIDVNKLSNEQFLELTNITNNDAIKQIVQNNLLISTTATLPIENIIDVKLNDSYQLEITLNNDFVKYSMPTNTNVQLNDNLLTITNLEYSNIINLLNINQLYEYINNLVKSNQFTSNELNNYINNNLTTLKTEIANRLLISDSESLDESEILNVAMNGNNLEITINGIHKKYIIESNSNITIVNNKDNAVISLKNLNLYTNIRFSNLASVRNNLQNIITNNTFATDDFSRYITNNQSSLKTMISNNLSKSIDGPGSWSINQINRVEYSGGNVKIYFSRPSNYKYTFESYSYASFANDVLTISNFSYYQPSPSSWFIWSGSTITGLTSQGQGQSSLAIPTNCTSLGEYAFRSNSSLRSIIIPGTVKTIQNAAIEKCTNLTSVDLREGINVIDRYAFGECSNLSSIRIPDSVTTLGRYAFNKCTNLNSFNLNYQTSKLSLIDEYAFNECINLTNVTLPATSMEIQYRAFYLGQYINVSGKTYNYYFYSTNIKLYSQAFYLCNAHSAGYCYFNIYFYNITNPNNLTVYKYGNDWSLFLYNKLKLNVYVKNKEIADKIFEHAYTEKENKNYYII